MQWGVACRIVSMSCCASGRSSHLPCGEPVAFAGEGIGRQTDPLWQLLLIEERPINIRSPYPCLRNLLKILLLAPDIQQRLFIFIDFKGHCIMVWGTCRVGACFRS